MNLNMYDMYKTSIIFVCFCQFYLFLFKYSYPQSTVKVAVAKGIVKAFPELADAGDCPYVRKAAVQI